MRAKQYFPLILVFSLLPSSAPADVYVRAAASTIKYRTFDPEKPPADMPHLEAPEAAVTVCGAGFSAEPHYDVVSRQRGADGNWTVEIACSGASIYVRQSIVIWTPKGVTAKLKAHEEGHRKLDEMLYKKLADSAARAAGAEMDGHRFTGEGATASKALTNAVQNMFQQGGRVYLSQCQGVITEINTTYDAITGHGTNDIPEADAMKQAMEQYAKDHAATRPAGENGPEKK